MRVKPVPAPPESIETLFEIRDAVPLVPEPEGSCCDRLVDRSPVEGGEAARDWLAFLRGLGLVVEGASGYHRTREGPDDLGAALLDGIYGAREVRAILEAAGESLSAGEVSERFEGVPRWEKHRTSDWRAVWRERIERLLEWLVLVGLAERTEGGYAPRRT
jgi:hypothetical protein